MPDTSPRDPMLLEDQLCFAIYTTGIAIQRMYKPMLDKLGLTYSQYLVLNVLWREDALTVGGIAERLALESSTLTPLLKRLEDRGLLCRERNPDNERQVIVSLTRAGRDLQAPTGCLLEALLEVSGKTPAQLAELNSMVRKLRDAVYTRTGDWQLPA